MPNDEEGTGREWYPGICYGTDNGYTRAEALASVGHGWSTLVARAWDAITAAGGRVSQVKDGDTLIEESLEIRAPAEETRQSGQDELLQPTSLCATASLMSRRIRHL
jgi:hypothetical protein